MKRVSVIGLIVPLIILFVFTVYVPNAKSTEINVPNDYTSIQNAINAANNGDVIIVHPETYYENIEFLGKAITIRSIDPIDPDVVANTIINGDENKDESVVSFYSSEGNLSVLSGFTIQNGKGYHYGAANYGGGICCSRSSPIIENCTIRGNSASYGGGISCFNYSHPIIDNCKIIENLATSGGGISCSDAYPTITNCVISGNSAAHDGGGINCGFSSSASFTNCIIYGNFAYNGGGICFGYSSNKIMNCTISDNSAVNYGDGICCFNSNPTFTNCIIYNNSLEEIYMDSHSSPKITYSNIKGGYTGTGNINADPLFIDSSINNFHLNTGSHCIDAGDPSSLIYEDIEGTPRPNDGDSDGIAICDMGAYEYSDSCHLDGDSDGYTTCGGDCDDNNAAINPSATEVCDGIDNNCDGEVDEGVLNTCTDYTDCSTYQSCDACSEAPDEICDGIDNDCDGAVDEGFDGDSDGYTTCGGDCDDSDSNTYPGALEIPYDNKDQDCNGSDLTDVDEDGYDSINVFGGTDCNDNNAAINPEATELCNDGIDNNCNDLIDFYDSYCLNTDPEGGLNHLKDIIADPIEFPTEWFKGNNDNRRTPISNKIDEVITLLQAAEVESDPDIRANLYQEAVDKLSNDILKKTNGCAASGSPDNNDWIDDCMGQDIICPIIQNLLSGIQGLI